MSRAIKPEWRTEQAICSYDVDPHQTARLPALCRFMQEAAYQHAGHLGLGHLYLAKRQLGWVLARQRIAVDHLPQWGYTIQIRTWPSGRDRLFFYRDFEITCESKRVLRASNAWSLIDLEKRARADSEIYMSVELPEGDPVFDSRPARIKGSANEGGAAIPVTYGDLDLNGHVNNTRYLEWISNSLPQGFHEMHSIHELECNYLVEAVYGQTVLVCAEESGPLEFNHSIRDGEVELFRARSVWRLM